MKKVLTSLITTCSILAAGVESTKAEMTDYCASPPFLSTDIIKPNILFVIDVSGSMRWSAYNPDSAKEDWCENPYGCGWSYKGNEEGYFEPDKVYKLVGSCDRSNYWYCYWEETSSTSYASCPNTWYQVYDNKKNYKGSCLNFLLMSRIDLLRWAITGGRPYGCSDADDSDCDPDIACTGSTCQLETYYGDRVIVPKSRIKGVLQSLENKKARPRFGALFFSGSSILKRTKVYIGDYLYDRSIHNADPDRPYTYLKRAINSINPRGSTPTGPAMWEAYDYFKQSDDHNIPNDFKIATSSNLYRDPLYVCDDKRENCKKVPCAKNYVILASDGQWNTNIYGYISCSIENHFEFDSTDPVVPAYLMHSKVLRTETSLSGIPFDIYVDKVYTLGLFLGGTGEQSLKNISVYGSFDAESYTWPVGTDGSSWNGTDSQYPWEACDMDDCGYGRGSPCTPLPPSSPDWDKDLDGNPDTFFNAKNAAEIKNSLLKFIGDILRRVASGSSISVLAEKGKKGSTIVQAVFYPEKRQTNKTLTWIGHLYQYWFLNTRSAQNIREDTNDNKKLDVVEDYILDFNIDSSGRLYIDAYESDSNGKKIGIATTYNSLDEIHYLWDAGYELAKMDESDRNIYGVDENNSLTSFIASNYNRFDSLLGTDSDEFPECFLDPSDNPDYEKLISYVRGVDFEGCRSRETDDGDIWKLADIVYSSPVIVNYGDYSVTYVGANDGMLHAFSSGYIKKQTGSTVAVLCEEKGGICGSSVELGKELWAFIPKNVMPYLRYYADPDYCHIYMVDLSPYVIDYDENGDGYTDKKILIGGFRLGGGCDCSSSNCVKPPEDTCPDPSDPDSCVGLSTYFALDITDPLSPKYLWEFTHKDLGFAYSGVAYIKRKQGDTWKHFLMFASGPTSYDGHSEKYLKLFVLDLITGNLIYEHQFNSLNNSFGGRLFTNGIDINSDGQTDYVFLGYTKTSGSSYQGGIIKIWTGDPDPSNWDFDNQYFGMVNQPVTAKIEFTQCFGKWYTFFGSGRYFYKLDDETDINALYGVPFLCDENNNCETSSITSAYNVQSSPLPCDRIGDKSGGAWMIPLMDKQGYFLKERNISDPSVSNFGAVFFTTTRPTGDVCGFGGKNRSWAFNCATGGKITDNTCSGASIDLKPFKYLVQLSGGNIEEYGKNSFTQEGGRATEEGYGIPSESGGKLITPSTISNLRILLWLEK